MDGLLRDGVDLQALSAKTLIGDSYLFEEVTTPGKIKEYLESSKDHDKVKGLKLLLAMLSKGKDVPEFLPDVIKNIMVSNIEVKKMVYIYLVHYADFNPSCREISLLSINSFQKDLSGSNPLIRGLALRVMTTIHVPDIIQIQLLAARKCAADSSPYVRKCAANALPKIYSFDKDQIDQLKQLIENLLKDTSTMVLGSAIAAFNEICPTSYDIIHRTYRKICHLLADLDEWSQISALEVMTRYTRVNFTDPTPTNTATAVQQAKLRSTAAIEGKKTATAAVKKRKVVKKAFYSDEEDETVEEEVIIEEHKPEIGSVFAGANADTDGDLDIDHRLILKSSLPLLKSRNSGVVLNVCTLHYYCGTQNQQTLHQIGKALVRISRNQREVQYIVLHAINNMARDRPQIFRPFLSDFYVKATDPLFNRLLKLEILTSLCTKDNIEVILRELQTYVKDPDPKFVSTAVKAVGRVVDVDPSRADLCMEGIMKLLLYSKIPSVISSCVVVLRLLIQQNLTSKTSARVMKQLVKLLIAQDYNTPKNSENTTTTSVITESNARSSIVWLIGEFQEPLMKVTPDILRVLAKRYVHESTETKMQILTLAIKIALQFPEDEKVQHLMTYVLEMSRYDVDTDLRDRARFMTALMGLAPTSDSENGEGGADGVVFDEASLGQLHQYAKGIMSAAKLPPVTLFGGVDVAGMGQFIFGSLTSVVGHVATGYNPLPDWSDVQPDSSIRDPVKYITSEEQLQSNQGSQEERRRRSDSSDSEIHVNASRDDDFKIFEDKTGTASISNSSEEESESDGGSSIMSSKSSEISSSDEEDERPRRKEKKRKSNKQSRSNGGDAGLDLMSVFKKTVPTSQPVVQESSRTSNAKSKSKSKSKSVSKSRSRHDHSDSESDKLTQSSDDDEEENGDLFSALGKTSRLKKSSAPNGSKENSGTIAKAGIRKVPLANNVFNSASSNLVGDITAPTNHMDDLEDAFGFLSTTAKPTAPTVQNVQQQSLNGRGMNINHSSNVNSGMTMTNNDFDALFMPKKTPTSHSSPAQHQPQFQLHDRNLMDFGGSMNSSVSPSIVTSPQTNQGKLDIPSPTSLSAPALPHPAMSLPPSVHSPPMNHDISLNGSSNSITSSQLLDFGAATNPHINQSVSPVSNVLIPTNSSIPNQSIVQSQSQAMNQQERVSNILTAFDGSSKATSTAQPSPTSYTQPVMLPNPPPISPHNTINNGTIALKSLPLQVHPIQQPATLPPHITTERPLEEFTDPRAIVNPAMSGGLLVSIAFRKGVKSATYIGATSLFVIIKNMKDKQPIKRIHIGFPSDVRKTNLPDLPIIHPGQEVFLPMEIVLTSFTSKSLKVDIRTDQGAFVGLFQINEWDIMTPIEITCNEFELIRDRYKGLREIVKSYPLSSLTLQYSDELELLIMNRIRHDLLMFLVQGVGIGELMFVGGIKKDNHMEEKVLLTILTNEREITIKVNAEDPVFNASFLGEVKRLIMKIKC